MSPRIQIPAPKLGLSIDTAHTEQPPQFTRLVTNCRLIDRATGRSRIAQRNGQVKFWTNSVGSRIDYCTSVPYNAPKIEYEILTEATTPAITAEATETPGGVIQAVRVDHKKNLYALVLGGRIEIYNPDLALLETIAIPLKPGELIGVQLAVDEARRIYACSNPGPTPDGQGPLSRIFQWVRVDDPERPDFLFYALRWTLDVPGTVRRIVAKAGSLWAIRRLAAGESFAHLTKYGGVTTEAPFPEWDTAVPDPVRDFDVNDLGEVYIVSPSNGNRGSAPGLGGLHKPVTSWTPHDLGYNAAAHEILHSDEYRLHAWVAANTNLGINQGQEITTLRDRRYIATRNTTPDGGQPPGNEQAPTQYGQGPDDYIARPLYKATADGRTGPFWATTGVAGMPAAFFDRHLDLLGSGFPGCALRSNGNFSAAFKRDTTAPSSQGTGSNSTAITLPSTGAWTALITITKGANGAHNGFWTALLTGQIDPPIATSDTTAEFRIIKGTVPEGAPVKRTFPGGGNPAPLNVVLPMTNDQTAGATYTIQGRAISVGDFIVQGNVVTTNGTLYFNDFNPDPNGLLPDQQSLVPGHQGVGGFGDNWAAVSSWQVLDQSVIQVLATQNGNVHKWALLANAKITTDLLHHQPGWVAFISNQMTGGESALFQVQGAGNFFNGWRGTSFNGNQGGLNPNGFLMITLSLSERGADSSTTQSFFRVHGYPAGRFNLQLMEAWAPGLVVFGNKHWKTEPDPSDLFPASIPFAPFHGYFIQWQTVLGRTTGASANDVPTTYPTVGGLPPASGTASGTKDPLTWDNTTPDTDGSYTGEATEIERLEGAVAHDSGLSAFMPSAGGGGPSTWNAHPFSTSARPPTGFNEPTDIDEKDRVLLSPRPILAKYGANGSGCVWALNGSGLGNSCVALPDRYVATIGEKDSFDTNYTNAVMRRVLDAGTAYSLAPLDGAWKYDDAGFVPSNTVPKLAADDAGQIYWPINENGTLVKHRGSTGVRLWTFTASGIIREVALDPTPPVYPPAVTDEDVSPIFVYLGGSLLLKLRVVGETQVIGDTASARKHRYIAVAGTSLYGGQRGGAASIVTGGSGLFDSVRTFVTGTTLFTKHYITDGRNYVEFDPVANTAQRLATRGHGEPPKRGRLLTGWLGRLVIARTQDDESTIFASAQGDATDWDYSPPNPSPSNAWNSTLGVGPSSPPDMITALMSLDDVLIVGCDHSIYKLRGDPRAGGTIDLLSSETGVAFGRTWFRDLVGRVYFFGQRGGVWVLTRGTDNLIEASRISEYRIERELQEIDLRTNRMELAWSHEEEGLYAIPVPYE